MPYTALEVAVAQMLTDENATGAFNKIAAYGGESHKKTVCQLLAWSFKESQPSDKFKELLSTIPATEVEIDYQQDVHLSLCRWEGRP